MDQIALGLFFFDGTSVFPFIVIPPVLYNHISVTYHRCYATLAIVNVSKTPLSPPLFSSPAFVFVFRCCVRCENNLLSHIEKLTVCVQIKTETTI
jgi:hypothetical protein